MVDRLPSPSDFQEEATFSAKEAFLAEVRSIVHDESSLFRLRSFAAVNVKRHVSLGNERCRLFDLIGVAFGQGQKFGNRETIDEISQRYYGMEPTFTMLEEVLPIFVDALTSFVPLDHYRIEVSLACRFVCCDLYWGQEKDRT